MPLAISVMGKKNLTRPEMRNCRRKYLVLPAAILNGWSVIWMANLILGSFFRL
jgi:hypothetical protein